MPIPFLFIGIAALTGVTGIGSTIKAGVDNNHANKLNKNSNDRMNEAKNRLEILRLQCGDSLKLLGEEKVYILNNSMNMFLKNFRLLKNVDFKNSLGIEEAEKLHIDAATFEDLQNMCSFTSSLLQGTTTGALGGALMAFGAYKAAGLLAIASTGTAINTLSGIAATNATLAFFGGGSLAVGGLGMAGGVAVLGGLVAGPALLLMGIITGAVAGKNLEKAKAGSAQATEICEQYENGAIQCIAIRRRTNMFYNLLARLDSYFLPLIYKMKNIMEKEGYDYSLYSEEGKRTVAEAVSIAITIKSVLDTPILTEEGELTKESENLVNTVLDDIKAKEEK